MQTMRTVCVCLVVLILLGGPFPGAAQSGQSGGASAEATKLPVRRVVLYKNGVGFFEHLGRVRSSQDVTIEFTSGQLNDVLKSLTTLDLGGGRITGVNYNSDAPLSRRLGALRLGLGEQTTLAQFLTAMHGARLEVRSGTSVLQGRLLSVERKTCISGGTTLEVDHLTLVGDGGDVRTVELSPAVSVRVVEGDLKTDVSRYLDLIGSNRANDIRRMTISTAGAGERQLYVSYISEVPVWKTTYRIVLPSKAGAKPLLQGWAIVDNTVGEDWNDVELSLVAGAPQSFIQQLSQPYYSRRPVVPLPESAMLTPQTHQATLIGGYGKLAGVVMDPMGAVIPGAQVRVYDERESLVAQQSTDAAGQYDISSLPAGVYRMELESMGFRKTIVQNVQVGYSDTSAQEFRLQLGEASETVTVMAETPTLNTMSAAVSGGNRSLGSGRATGSGRGLGPGEGGVGGGVFRPAPPPPTPAAMASKARERMETAAQGQELGDLFEYKLKERVSIAKNQSAMVPIVHTDIAAEKVSLWNESQGSSRPLRALWLTNSSNLTLDGGSFSVLEDETFAGEGLTDALKPGEKRLLSYAIDLSMTVDTKRESERQRVTRVRIARGLMIHISEEREKRTYTVRNEDTTARTLVIEHPVRREWKLADNMAAPAETSSAYHRFRITVEPKKTASLTVNEVRPIEARYQITDLHDDQIALFLRQKSINPRVEEALRPILQIKQQIAALEEQISERESRRDEIFDDQQRVRENMKALKGSSEEKQLLQRYTRQLDQQENQLEALRAEIAQLTQKRDTAQAELTRMAQDLVLDVSL